MLLFYLKKMLIRSLPVLSRMRKTKEKNMTKKELNMKMMDSTGRRIKILTIMSNIDKSSWTNNRCR